MKKTYHLCLSAGDEIMFRDLEDYNRGFNCFALAAHRCGATGLVEAFMSTHCHMLLQCSDPKGFMHAFRQAYCIYFNHKYHRSGRLGEKQHFSLDVVGYHHIVAAASYVLRNPLHHGIAPIPYAYPHCSANAIFKKEMGKFHEEHILPRRYYSRFIGRRAECPDSYKMNEQGVFLRESVLDIPQMESLFVSPRTYNYYMSRKSSEEWYEEQKKDNNGIQTINLANIEEGVQEHKLEQMLYYENGKADYRNISDIELCTAVDSLIKQRFHKESVYQLQKSEKQALAEILYKQYRVKEAQIRRCLCLH